jgi:hypothetical protein
MEFGGKIGVSGLSGGIMEEWGGLIWTMEAARPEKPPFPLDETANSF